MEEEVEEQGRAEGSAAMGGGGAGLLVHGNALIVGGWKLLQARRPQYLPTKLRSWAWLPEPRRLPWRLPWRCCPWGRRGARTKSPRVGRGDGRSRRVGTERKSSSSVTI